MSYNGIMRAVFVLASAVIGPDAVTAYQHNPTGLGIALGLAWLAVGAIILTDVEELAAGLQHELARHREARG